MDAQPRSVENYVTPQGKSPFGEWVRSLRDKRAVARILQRIDRVRLGNFGDCRSVGDGVYELRVHWGPGFRVYFGIASDRLVILLCGGDKRSQSKDIAAAQTYWKDYQRDAHQ